MRCFAVACLACTCFGAAAAAGADAASACDLDLNNAFGPFDYRVATQEQVRIVELNHFTPQVEGLIRGITGPLGGDIDYTLRAFPNHPRALLAMAKLARREGKDKPIGSKHTVECWFQRAIAFQPKDGFVRMAYGVELLRGGQAKLAIRELLEAESLGGTNANVSYNLGLAYFELKDFDASMDHARKAYALGFPLPGLKDKLKRIGKWKE